MVRHLKYKIVDSNNHIVHHSYNKQNAKRWIEDFGKNDDTYHIRKLSDEERRKLNI